MTMEKLKNIDTIKAVKKDIKNLMNWKDRKQKHPIKINYL